jgi:hypothetical protein
MYVFVWALALIVAVVWPGRLTGPLDGAPFDAPVEALLLAAVLPVLWFLAPRFLRARASQVVIGVLLFWKIAGWLLLTQHGWCSALLAAPDAGRSTEIQASWDVRTLWTAPRGCTAIATRPYREFEEFPAWAVNLLPASARPPAGTFALRESGFVSMTQPGRLSILTNPESTISAEIDGRAVTLRDGAVALDAGAHHVDLTAELHGAHWRFEPRVNDADLFGAARTYVSRPSTLDRVVGGWGRWVSPALLVFLLGTWLVFAVQNLRVDRAAAAWAVVAAAAAFLMGLFVEPPAARFTMLGVAAAVALPISRPSQSLRCAFLLIALPWLAFYGGRALHDVGRVLVYTAGDDWWTFQRHAYRIYVEGFWFEGGEKTFWNQPLYRWTAGLLHLVFGDSSAGEMYLDAAGVAVGAMFAFDAVSRLSSFRFGLVAAVLVLNVAMLGPNWYGIGRGLSEISAALFLYLAAFALRRSDGRLPVVLLAGLMAALAFFTRLNLLVLLVVLTALLIPSATEAGAVWRPSVLWNRFPRSAGVTYLLCVFAALVAIALRTWFYTGHFSLFLGTQRDLVSTGLGFSTMFSRAAWGRALESVAMIVTVQDPPRLDPRVIVVTLGVACAGLALLGVPGVRKLPLWMAVFCLGACAGGLFVRGSAYAGRFSVQLIPIGTAVAVGSIALAFGRRDRSGEVHYE